VIVYLDPSAIVRDYLDEPFRDELRVYLASAQARVTQAFGYTEVASAFAKARRMNRISLEDSNRVMGVFEEDWRKFHRVMPDEWTARRAAALVDQFELRAMDAIHLAAAERVQFSLPPWSFVFVSFDDRQLLAAVRLQMQIPEFLGHGGC